MITVVMTAVMIMAAMTPAVTLVVEIMTAAEITPVEMRPAATMDSAMIQQQIPEQVLKNSNRELL